MDKAIHKITRIARKEFAGFFASPVAFIFLGAFLLVTLFTFFWVETFFSRNIADVRPLFEWMPVLLIFLAAAITMRMWAEERRAGTLEFLLTTPVRPVYFVLGKFLACLALVAVALALTLPLPISVSLLGELDWGPVIGGYIATLFLAAAYIAIGLFISSRSDSQIVSLILTSVVCGLLLLSGSTALTDLFGNRVSEILRLLGSGSRFESIARGVLDFRDLYYYVSLVGLFLTLNVFMLEWLRWAGNRTNQSHRQWGVITALLCANFLAANLWLTPVSWARADVTEGNVYSISDATRGYLAQLREPLLIRGYFSAQTHPYLAPLVPQLRDLLEEYEIAGKGRIKIEIVDPANNARLEEEAAQRFDIRPEPFQVASKYQSSIVNSYFDILVKYGDQHETLGFRELIEYKTHGPEEIDVRLRNPEYDITQAIKKVLYAYQASGKLFNNIEQTVKFKGYISPDEKLPQELVEAKKALQEVLKEYKEQSGGKLEVEIVDPDAFGGTLAEKLQNEYGFRPMWTGLIGGKVFWFYMMLEGNGMTAQIPLTENLSKSGLEDGLKTALKRFSKGFMKTVALHAPPASTDMSGQGTSTSDFKWLRSMLEQQHAVIDADLKNGYVPETADLLILASPRGLDEKQLFAVDQFLMQGGTVILAASTYEVGIQNSVSVWKRDHGLNAWLAHHGIEIPEKLVLDPQNSAFPVPVQRQIGGGFVVQEMRMIDYPYFVDVREGADESQGGGIMSGVNQVTVSWPSPIVIDSARNASRRVKPLLYSSEDSWTSTDQHQATPDFSKGVDGGIVHSEPEGRQLLAAAIEGQFESFFKGKESPLAGTGTDEATSSIARIIEKSPESARLILFSSPSFVSDQVLNVTSRVLGTQYLNPAQLVANAVDLSLEEQALLAIRGRAHYSRMLDPMSRDAQMFWEYLNYALGLLGLAVVWLLRRRADKKARIRYTALLTG